jgi:hypothetical protein
MKVIQCVDRGGAGFLKLLTDGRKFRAAWERVDGGLGMESDDCDDPEEAKMQLRLMLIRRQAELKAKGEA